MLKANGKLPISDRKHMHMTILVMLRSELSDLGMRVFWMKLYLLLKVLILEMDDTASTVL